MLNTQRIVNLWARSKAWEGEMQVLLLPYLGWALHSTSSRCFSASANSKEHRVSIWDRGSSAETEISNSLWIIDFLFHPSDFLYHCRYAFGWLGFAHRLYPPSVSPLVCCFLCYDLVEDCCRYRMGISIEHQTKDWCRQLYFTHLSRCENVWFELSFELWSFECSMGDVGHISDLKWLKSMVNCMLNNTKWSLKHPIVHPI